MRALRKHFPELWLSYASVHISDCRRCQRMAQPFRQVAAKLELYFLTCLNVSRKSAICEPHL
jgi:hypothetical protein